MLTLESIVDAGQGINVGSGKLVKIMNLGYGKFAKMNTVFP